MTDSHPNKQKRVHDLKAAPWNPRKISKEQLQRLAKAMAEYGDLSGVVMNRRSGQLVGGHQRVAVFDPAWPVTVERTYEPANAVGTVADGKVETPWGPWTYREVDWDEAREAAANIAANQHGGEWDLPKLGQILSELDDGAFDMDLTGFSTDELSDLLGGRDELVPGDDEVPPAPREPVSRPGDVWVCGGHRIVCGDSTDPAAWAALLSGDPPVDLCVTSPPYNLGIAYRSFKDRKQREAYLALVSGVAAMVVRHLAPGRFVCWNIGVNPDTFPHRQVVALEDQGLEFYRQIVWEKAGVPYPVFPVTLKAKRARKYTPNYKHEVVDILEKPAADDQEHQEAQAACPLCDGGGTAPAIDMPLASTADAMVLLTSGRKPELGASIHPLKQYANDVWHISQSMATKDIKTVGTRSSGLEKKGKKSHMVKEHPAIYPVELPWALMRFLSAPGELVVDPFGGAGTTMIAAERCGRKARLLELDPVYCDVAVERWKKATRKEPELIRVAA